MAFVFEASNLKHKNIIFICSTNFHLIKNNATKETIMNIAEYGITNITSNGYDCWIAISETTSLQQAVEKYDYAGYILQTQNLRAVNFLNIYMN